MAWVRASEFAAQRRVCKKTALRMAKLAGFPMENARCAADGLGSSTPHPRSGATAYPLPMGGAGGAP